MNLKLYMYYIFLIASFGTPVQRKLEIISWYSTTLKPELQNRPTLIDAAVDVKNSDSIKLKLRTPLLTSLLKSKPGKTESNLNSLQKLSQSYEDSNSPVNSASFSPTTSPTSTELKQLGTIETNKGKPEKIPETERLDKMTDKNSKINDEKRLINLIRKVFKEEFAQQEKNILNLISVNFSITQ